MRRLVPIRRWVSALTMWAAAYCLTAAPAAAQCILCYTSAAGAGDRGIRAIQIGILIMMVPTVTIFGGLAWMVFSRRHGDRPEPDSSEMELQREEERTSLRVSQESEGLSSAL